MVRREITRRSFEGWRYSVFNHEDLHGWVLLVYLDRLSGSWTQVARLLNFGVEQIVWGGVLSAEYAAQGIVGSRILQRKTSSAGYAAHRVVGGRILQERTSSIEYAAQRVADGRIVQGRIASAGYATHRVVGGRILQGRIPSTGYTT